MPATPDWADLFDAPLDDEPFTDEEQAAADEAMQRFRQGHYVLLDDLMARVRVRRHVTVTDPPRITASFPRQ